MENLKNTQGGAGTVTALIRDQIAAGVSGIVHSLAAYNLTAAELEQLLAEAVEGSLHDAVPGSDAGEPVRALDLVTASVHVAEAAEDLTHVYVQAAGRAGYTWADVAQAAGLASPQAAHWRWGKNARDVTVPASTTDRPVLPSGVGGGLMPVRPATIRDEGWETAAALGKRIGRDPRTVREMGTRGEVEVLHREPGRDGRTRDLYRQLQVRQ
jgi:cyanate lyase